MLLLASPAMGQDPDEATGGEEEPSGWGLLETKAVALVAATIGASLVILAGARSISHMGSTAVEAMARQPEAAGSINGVAIILGAMIEGATLFAVVVCLLVVLYGG